MNFRPYHNPMKYIDEQIQAAIDAACQNINTTSNSLVSKKAYPKTWRREPKARLTVAKAFLEKLEPADPYAELKKAHAEGNVIQFKPHGCSWEDIEDPDFIAPLHCYRIKPEIETFEAHGKTWTKHKDGDPMPCDRKAQVEITYGADNRWLSKQRAQWWNWINGRITGWRYADEQPEPKPETPAWTPTIGDVVQLKSGGPKMTIAALSEQTSLVPCQWFEGKNPRSHAFPQACLTPIK